MGRVRTIQIARGATLLARYIKAKGLTMRGASSHFGVSHPTAYHWVEGFKRPAPDMRDAIAKKTDGAVPADSWSLPGDREAGQKGAA